MIIVHIELTDFRQHFVLCLIKSNMNATMFIVLIIYFLNRKFFYAVIQKSTYFSYWLFLGYWLLKVIMDLSLLTYLFSFSTFWALFPPNISLSGDLFFLQLKFVKTFTSLKKCVSYSVAPLGGGQRLVTNGGYSCACIWGLNEDFSS